MKNLQISNEHRLLIESIIRENPKYKGHEELLDSFVDAIYKKSYLLMEAIKDMSRLRRHLLIIAEGTMESIIKEKRIDDEAKLYKRIQEDIKKRENVVSLKDSLFKDYRASENLQKKEIVNLKEEIQKSERYDGTNELNDPLDGLVEKEIPMDTVDKLVHIVKIIDSKHPGKNYYEIFSLRYIKKNPQSEIARIMGISQIELSKRYVELIEYVKQSL